MLVEFLIKKFFKSYIARTECIIRCMMHLLLSVLQTIFLIRSLYVKSQSIGSTHRLATQHSDERYKRKQSESFSSQPEHTIWVSRLRTLRTHIFIWVFLFESSILFLQFTKNFASCKVFDYVLLH